MSPCNAVDPVCGMETDPGPAEVVEYADRRYLFCETTCADTFRDDPERWIPTEEVVEV